MLTDYQGNWTAAYALMKSRSLEGPPGTVTAEYTIRFLKPTPILTSWTLHAWPTRIEGDRVTVDGEVLADGQKTASTPDSSWQSDKVILRFTGGDDEAGRSIGKPDSWRE